MKHFGWIAVVAAAAGTFAGYGVLELLGGAETWSREIGGVQIGVTAERRLYAVGDVLLALAGGALVAAIASYALGRAIPVTPRRRRR